MAPSPKKKKDKANVKPRNWLTISQKLEIIRMKEVGSSFAKIASEKNIAESSVRAIFSRKDEIKAQGKENYLYQKDTYVCILYFPYKSVKGFVTHFSIAAH